MTSVGKGKKVEAVFIMIRKGLRSKQILGEEVYSYETHEVTVTNQEAGC